MSNKTLTFIYFFLLFIELIGEYVISKTSNGLIVFFSKPLLMIVLMFLAHQCHRHYKLVYFKWLLLALIFSMFGDIALMFLPYNKDIFILGLACFLLAHIFYILLFHKAAPSHQKPINLFFIIIPLVYGIGLIYFLYQQNTNDFNKLQIAVIVYASVILLMLIAALNRHQRVSNLSYKTVALGALLFVLSDTTIALNKFSLIFVDNELLARLLIMSLYGLAQYLIVKGLLIEARVKHNQQSSHAF